MAIEKSLLQTPLDIDPSLLIGEPSIDAEHLGLIAKLDSLVENPDAHPRSEVFSEILGQLGRQIGAHFDNEEAIFKTLDMPADEVLDHVQAHDLILDQYTSLCLDLMAGKPLAHDEVLLMIKRWIVGHVVNYDRKIRNFLRPMDAQTSEGR